MKNAIKIFIALFVTAVLFSSCKKDWVCECTATESTTGTVITNTANLPGLTKKDAEQACEQTSTVGTITTVCVLK